MSFKIKYGDLFQHVNKGYILHGCNAQGVMGSGVARIVKEMYPLAYHEYRRAILHDNLLLGEINPVQVTEGLVILNGITQDNFGRDKQIYVDYAALEEVFYRSIDIAESGIVPNNELHMPLVGGGLGGGNKEYIIEMMNKSFAKVNTNTTLWLLETDK